MILDFIKLYKHSIIITYIKNENQKDDVKYNSQESW